MYVLVCLYIIYRGFDLYQNSYGWVYIISNPLYPKMFKIGMTGKVDPYRRIDELNNAAIPEKFVVHVLIKTKHYKELEKNYIRNSKIIDIKKNISLLPGWSGKPRAWASRRRNPLPLGRGGCQKKDKYSIN